MKRGLIFYIFILFCPFTVRGYYVGPSNAGIPAEFLLTMGGSARGMAMGNACSSIDRSCSAPYWNPAGLSGVEDYELSLLYVPLWMEGKYAAASYAYPLPPAFGLTKDTTLGLSYYMLQSGLAEKTDVLKQSVGWFRDEWNVFYLTYARKLSAYTNLGFNVKFLIRSFAGYDTKTSGMDVGFQKKIFLDNNENYLFNWSISVQNLMFQRMRLRSFEQIPPQTRLGLSLLYKKRLLIALDIDQVLGDNPVAPKWSLGSEIKLLSLCKLRAGINYKQLSAGLGFHFFNLALDYAFVFHNLGPSHRFGVNFRFGGKGHDEEYEFIKRAKEKLKNKEKELELASESYRHLVNTALELFQQGKSAGAKQELQRICQLDPFNEKTSGIIAELLKEIDIIEGKKKMDEAAEYYDGAFRYFKTYLYDLADQEVNKALKIYPEYKEAQVLKYWNLGFRDIADNKLEKGKENLKKALEIDPENKELKKQLEKLKEYIELQKEGGNK